MYSKESGEDLINVIYQFRTFVRQRHVIGFAIIVLLGILFGITVVVRTPDYHVAYSTVRIGSVGTVGLVMPSPEKYGGTEAIREFEGVRYWGLEPGRRLLVDKSALYRQLSMSYNIPAARNGKLNPPYLFNIDGQDADGLRIYVKGESEQQAKVFLTEIVTKILSSHEVIYQDLLSPLMELRHFVDSLVEKHQILDKKNYSGLVANLIKQKYEIDRALSIVNTHPTTVSNIVFSPIQRKSLYLYVTAGAIVGCLIGVLWILLVMLLSATKNNRAYK